MSNRNPGIDPKLLALSAGNTRSPSSRQRKSLATYQKFRETLGRGNLTTKFGTGNFIEDTIILDIGSRYSKVGFVAEPGPRRICRTHLRLGDERKSEPYSSQKFKACATLKPVVLSLSKTPQSPQTWQEITELLVNDLLFTQLEIKPDKRRIIVLKDPWWPSSFQNALARSFYRHGCPGLHFIDSLHSALFVTGGRSGIVIDVGYHTTKIQASMHGHILPETRGWRTVGFYKIMQEFKILMRELARLDFNRFTVDEHQIEKAIARTCFVQPYKYKNKNDDTKDEDDTFTPNGVSYEFNVKKQSAFCKITPSIRRRICEVLFDDKTGNNIVHFLCDQLLKAPIDCRGILVNNILLTGGTVQIPGFEARFMQEWNAAMLLPKYKQLTGLKHRFRLVPCKFPSNIRMFVGASIYGDLTSRFVDELFITKDKFEKEQDARIDDWTQHSVYPFSQTVKKLTHADIVRKPQYRGRPTYNIQRRSMGLGSAATNRYRARLGGGTPTQSPPTGADRLGTGLVNIDVGSSAPGSTEDALSIGRSPIAQARRTIRFGAGKNALLDPKTGKAPENK
eukprot:292352_1